jgi:hypothetical protein
MMPFCQCFARRVKSGRRRAPRSRDIRELFASDQVRDGPAWQQLKMANAFNVCATVHGVVFQLLV